MGVGLPPGLLEYMSGEEDEPEDGGRNIGPDACVILLSSGEPERESRDAPGQQGRPDVFSNCGHDRQVEGVLEDERDNQAGRVNDASRFARDDHGSPIETTNRQVAVSTLC